MILRIWRSERREQRKRLKEKLKKCLPNLKRPRLNFLLFLRNTRILERAHLKKWNRSRRETLNLTKSWDFWTNRLDSTRIRNDLGRSRLMLKNKKSMLLRKMNLQGSIQTKESIKFLNNLSKPKRRLRQRRSRLKSFRLSFKIFRLLNMNLRLSMLNLSMIRKSKVHSLRLRRESLQRKLWCLKRSSKIQWRTPKNKF